MINDFKIFNGGEVKPNSWPWMVRMMTDWNGLCGGTVLNKNWIITAASCCDEGYIDYLPYFVIGDHTPDTYDGTEQVVRVRATFIHPKYEQVHDYNDDNADDFRYNYDVCLNQVADINFDEIGADIACLPDQGIHISPNDISMEPDCMEPYCMVVQTGK